MTSIEYALPCQVFLNNPQVSGSVPPLKKGRSLIIRQAARLPGCRFLNRRFGNIGCFAPPGKTAVNQCRSCGKRSDSFWMTSGQTPSVKGQPQPELIPASVHSGFQSIAWFSSAGTIKSPADVRCFRKFWLFVTHIRSEKLVAHLLSRHLGVFVNQP
jgi:hypothetical protein